MDTENRTTAVIDAPAEGVEVAVRPGRAYRFIKRTFDVVAAAVLSVLLLVPVLIISAVIIWKDPGNPFYLHKRIGQNGRVIGVLKFRTMRLGADDLEKMLTPEQIEEYKQEFKLKDDPRLIGYKKTGDGESCFGALLRKSSLDELPQIFYNVLLKGNMSFTGPRPVLQEELEKYYSPAEQTRLLSVKPGITGYWQTHGRNDCTYESGDRQKLELYYIEHQSVSLDSQILFKTINVVIHRGGDILKSFVRRQRTYNGNAYSFVKRSFDILISTASLVILMPILVIVGLLVVLDDPKGSPVFVQRRVGKDGREFRFYKFRSMVVNAEEQLDSLMEQNEMDGPAFKIKDDPRITRVGRFIRKTSIDELPQLINVLHGEMSIVGPRPPLPREVAQYSDYQRQRLSVKPGLTCYWQVRKNRNQCSFDEWVEMDLKYIREQSIKTDLMIIVKTFGAVFGMSGE